MKITKFGLSVGLLVSLSACASAPESRGHLMPPEGITTEKFIQDQTECKLEVEDPALVGDRIPLYVYCMKKRGFTFHEGPAPK